MKFEIKPGVNIYALAPIMFPALLKCAEIFERYNQVLTVTSTNDGEHSACSYHYVGLAFDIRTQRLSDVMKAKLFAAIAAALHRHNPAFDVVLEPSHIHVELDSRKATKERGVLNETIQNATA